MEICLEDYSEEEQARYNRIKNMSKEELSSINPAWVTQENKEQLVNASIFYGLEDDVIIINVVLQRLIDQSEFLGLDPQRLITDDANDFRFVEIIERWENGKVIDPPEVSFQENSNHITFMDGRHRTIAAYQIGAESIPVAIKKQELERFKSLLV